MFQQSVINELARKLNDRFYQSHLAALGVVSQLLTNRNHGVNTVSVGEIQILINNDLEKAFPIPYLNISVDEEEGTASINGYQFHTPEIDQGMQLTYRMSPAWCVVVKDDMGQYHLVACSDRYAIPAGELTVPFDYEERKSRMGTVEQDNFLITSGQVIWVIDTWAAAGIVLSAPTVGIPAGIARRHKASDQPPQYVGDDRQAQHIDIDANWLYAFGIKVEDSDLSLFELVERLAKAEVVVAETKEKEPESEENETLNKMLKAIDITAILEDIIKLPKNKRTKNAIREHFIKTLLPTPESK